jgi:hypothetical protein
MIENLFVFSLGYAVAVLFPNEYLKSLVQLGYAKLKDMIAKK